MNELPERTNAAVFQQTEESNNAEDIVEPQRTLQQKEKPSSNWDIKVQMSRKRQRKQMSGSHKISADVPVHAPVCVEIRPVQRVRPKTNYSHGESLHAWKSSLGICVSSKSRYVRNSTPAVSHMSPAELPTEWKQSQRIIKMFEANHESELLGREFLRLSVKAIPETLCILQRMHRTSSTLNRALVVTQRSHSLQRHNKIDVFKE